MKQTTLTAQEIAAVRLRMAIDQECRPTINAIHAASDSVSDAPCLEFNGFAHSDEEPQLVEFYWLDDRVTVDLRKPLPRQVAAALRRTARQMLRNASAIESIEDCRNLRTVRRLIG